jgi:ATP-binding cassette subfamily F protein uup
LLFSGLSFTVSPGTRIGLVGRNGCGKSSLLSLLDSCARGEGHPQQGRVSAADGLAVVNFVQDRRTLNPDASLRQALAPEGDSIVFRERLVHVVSWAKRFLFRPDQLDSPVRTLSGGEQARILIAELMRQPADILLLDEPTNDLDIASLDVLEEGLLDFKGAVILVTHDRYLLDRVCDAVLGFVGEGEVALFGDYEQWLKSAQAAARTDDEPKASASPPKTKKQGRRGRLGYLEQLEYDQMEGKILVAEQACEELETQIADPELAADPEKLQSVWKELDRARTDVEQLYARWDQLEQKKMQ